MQFYIEADHGTSIHGWLASDNPSDVPTVRVLIPNRDPIDIEASEMRIDIREAGLHGTGLVGFVIHGDHIEDLIELKDFEIVDAHSGIQVYRRTIAVKHLRQKFFCLDVSLMPQNKMYKNINLNFAMNYNFIEKYAFDTMTCLINRSFSPSVVLTGRPYLARYISHLKNSNFFTSALIADPIEELAERLLFIRLLGNSNAAHLTSTFTTGVEALVPFANSLNLDDEKAMNLAFRRASDEVKAALTSPMVRAIGCQPGEEPEHRHLSQALDNLSILDAVGSKSRFQDYRALLSGLLERDILGESYSGVSQAVQDLALRLSNISSVNNLLELDLAFYSYVDDAIDAGLNSDLEQL